jgi:hypothetical protein
MAKSSRKQPDPNIAAFSIVQQVTGETTKRLEKNPAAVALGRLGGLKGGRARADSLSPETRKKIAKKAAQTRWAAEKDKSD